MPFRISGTIAEAAQKVLKERIVMEKDVRPGTESHRQVQDIRDLIELGEEARTRRHLPRWPP